MPHLSNIQRARIKLRQRAACSAFGDAVLLIAGDDASCGGPVRVEIIRLIRRARPNARPERPIVPPVGIRKRPVGSMFLHRSLEGSWPPMTSE